MSQLFLDQLDPERKRVFDKLAAFTDTFVLAGGTAIMLQIGHRKSFDFDLFLPNPIPRTLYETIKTNSLSLSDKRDIATDKAMTLGRRNA